MQLGSEIVVDIDILTAVQEVNHLNLNMLIAVRDLSLTGCDILHLCAP